MMVLHHSWNSASQGLNVDAPTWKTAAHSRVCIGARKAIATVSTFPVPHMPEDSGAVHVQCVSVCAPEPLRETSSLASLHIQVVWAHGCTCMRIW